MLFDALGENLAIDPWPAYGGNHLSGYIWTQNIYINPSFEVLNRDVLNSFYEFFLSPTVQSILVENGQIPATLGTNFQDPLIAQSVEALSFGTPFPPLPELDFYWEPLHQAFVTVFDDGGDVSLALQIAADQIIKETRDFKNTEDDF